MIQWTTSVAPPTAFSFSQSFSEEAQAQPGLTDTRSLGITTTSSGVWSSTEGGRTAAPNAFAPTIILERFILGNFDSTESGPTFTNVTLNSTEPGQTSTTATQQFFADIIFTTSAQRFVPTIVTATTTTGDSAETTTTAFSFSSVSTTRSTFSKDTSSRTVQSVTSSGTHLGGVLAATIYQADDSEVLLIADASQISDIHGGAATEQATTATRITVQPVTDVSVLHVLNPANADLTTQIYSSVAATASQQFAAVTQENTTSTSIVILQAIPAITESVFTQITATTTASESRQVFSSFSTSLSYKTSASTQTGISIFTNQTHFNGQTNTTIYTDYVTRTVSAQLPFTTSFATSTSIESPLVTFTTTSQINTTTGSSTNTGTATSTTSVQSESKAADYFSAGETKHSRTVIAENINAATTLSRFASVFRSIVGRAGVRGPQDEVFESYAAQGLESTIYVDEQLYANASRGVLTLLPKTLLFYTDNIYDYEAETTYSHVGTISISKLSVTGTSTATYSTNSTTSISANTFTFALAPAGSAITQQIATARQSGVAELGKFETAVQRVAAGVYSSVFTSGGGATTRLTAPELSVLEGGGQPAELFPITFFTTRSSSQNAYSIVWSARRNSTALPPALPPAGQFF